MCTHSCVQDPELLNPLPLTPVYLLVTFGMCCCTMAQVHLGLTPSGIWCEAWSAAVKHSWGSADAPAVCKTLWAAAKHQLPMGRAWLTEALHASHHGCLQPALAAQQLSCEELLRLMWAVGRLCRGLLSQGLSDLMGLYCCRMAGKMTSAQLVRGAWGLARLVPLPREGLLSYFHDLAASRLAYMPPAQQAEVGAKLQLLKEAAVRAQQFGGSNSSSIAGRSVDVDDEEPGNDESGSEGRNVAASSSFVRVDRCS